MKHQQLSQDLDAAEEKREEILKDIMRRVFAQFAEHMELWKKGVN